MADGLSGGAIAGLVIGLLCITGCFVLLIFWLVRCRNYWISRKHTKMPNHPSAEVPACAANRLYSSDQSDCRLSSESWTNGSFGQPKSNWNSALSSSSTTQKHSPKESLESGPHSAPGDFHRSVNFGHTWVDTIESPFGATSAPYAFAAPSMLASVPEVDGVQQSVWSGPERIFVGDCSGTDNNAFNLYPTIPRVPGDVEKTDSDLGPSSSGGKHQSRVATLRRKLRNNVQKVARASQSEVFRFNRTRSTHNSTTRESKRTKRSKRKSRKSVSALSSGLGAFGDEGYYNMNVASDCYKFDDTGSLDNDNFLCSLEKAVFPGLTDTNSSLTTTHCQDQLQQPLDQPGFWPSNPHKRTSLSFLGSGSDYLTLACADLSLGSNMPGSYWNPIQQDPRTFPMVNNSFRFPAPGPPVAGWAHQLAYPELGTGMSTSPTPTTPSAGQVSGETASSSKDTLSPGMIPPPFSPREHRSRLSESHSEAHTSSVAIPRRRAGQKTKSRQMSEPRKQLNVMEQDCNELAYCSHQAHDQHQTNIRPTSFGSATTLASILDPVGNQYLMHDTIVSDNPVDSGYQDSMVDTSLDMSTQSSISPHKLTFLSMETDGPPPMGVFLMPEAYAKAGHHPLMGTVPTSKMFRTELTRGRQKGRLVPDLSDKLACQYISALADITTSQSSNGASNESGDSTTIMLSCRSKERSTSVTRQVPSTSDPPHQYRSPSFPDIHPSHPQFSLADSSMKQPNWSPAINKASHLSNHDQENVLD